MVGSAFYFFEKVFFFAHLNSTLPDWRFPAHLALAQGRLQWRRFLTVPLFGVPPGTGGLGDCWKSPSRGPFERVQTVAGRPEKVKMR